jgi:hypothetical protein
LAAGWTAGFGATASPSLVGVGYIGERRRVSDESEPSAVKPDAIVVVVGLLGGGEKPLDDRGVNDDRR